MFALLFILIIVIVSVRFFIRPAVTEIVLASDLHEINGEILPGQSVDAVLPTTDGKLISFSVFFSTFNRQNDGTLNFAVLENGEGKYEKQIQINDISDNQYYDFNDLNLELSKKNEYEIVITSNPSRGAVTTWKDTEGKLVGKGKVLAQPGVFTIIVTIITYCIISFLLCIMIGFLKK